MRRFFQFLLVLMGCLQLCGGPPGLMQCVAWSGMLVRYTQQQGSVAEAVSQTFDGAHPCSLCRAIAEAKKQQQRQTPDQEKAPSGESLRLCKDMTVLPADDLPPPLAEDVAFVRPVAPPAQMGCAHAAPPVPPPRAAT